MSELSAADQKKVRAGAQVMTTQDLAGYPWPRARIYQTVDASPAQVMAVFFDYDNAHTFIPNCLESKISKKLNPRTFEVDYRIDVPILPDEVYTVRNELSRSADGSLQVDWRVLKATSILESEGSLKIEPLGAGSILRYTNLVKPSSAAAGLLRGMAMSQMKDTVQAIAGQAEKLRPAGGGTDMQRLDAALDEKK